MIREKLTEDWKVKAVGDGQVFTTDVPASVLSVLLDNGKIEDPYYRDNEDKCMELFEKDYEFSKVFSVTGDIMREEETDLIFYGIDTVATIYLNDVKLASVNNMHRTYRFSVKDKVRPGANEIKVVIKSPLKYMREYPVAEGKEIKTVACNNIKGSQYIRKAHSMSGWDWGPKLPDMGIFRDVEIESYSKACIKDIYFSQVHDYGSIKLIIDPVLKITDNIPLEINITMTGQDDISTIIHLPKEGETETPREINKITIPVRNPRIWWPNGMGEQPLYDIKISVCKAGVTYDERTYRIGLRTFTVSTEKDSFGNEFTFMVNGVKMFAMGANYIPEDCIYSRINRQKQEMLIRSAARAHFNTLRVWGGGYYPSDDFYDLCDEYGLLVWQDLMFACLVYDLNDDLEENILSEIKDNVSRLRHHACLALWCGNNEMESGWSHWPSFAKESPKLRADYIKMFEYLIPKAIKEFDDTTIYWPSSPSSGGCIDNPDDENRGDCHYWDVWHGQKPFTDYRKHYFRFLSEFGFQSFPCMKTVSSFTLPEDRNVFSYVMEKHQKNDSANSKILYYMSQNFQNPVDFESLLYVSQLLQGMAIKYGVDHFRRNRGRCMGTLYWQLNDNWPVASWSSIDYYGRWKALHYMAKEFFNPVVGTLVRVEDEGGNLTSRFRAYVVNDSPEAVNVKVIMTLHTMDGKDIVHFEDTQRVLSQKVAEFKEIDVERYVGKNGSRNVYMEARFVYTGRETVSIETLEPYKHLNLVTPNITYTVEETEVSYEITLVSDTFTPFVMLDLTDRDAVFESNVVMLTAQKPETIILYKDEINGGAYESIDDFCDHLDIWYLQKSYMNYPEVLDETEEEQKYD